VQQRQLDALTNGATISGSTGSATPPTPPGRTPDAPGGSTGKPSVSGAAYVDSSGHIRAVINVQWPAVTADGNGQAIEVDHYEVRVRKVTSN
jgi:hypothetical protein